MPPPHASNTTSSEAARRKPSPASNTSIKRNFRIFSGLIFCFIVLIGTVAFIFSTRQIGYLSVEDKLSLLAETTRLRLATAVNSELALALEMADSPAIQRYFLQPENKTLKEAASEVFAAHRKNFKSNVIFWSSNIDKKFYTNDGDFYVINPSLPENYWYNKTLYNTGKYNFNINYNPDLNQTNLWINAPVFAPTLGGARKPIGLLGTGVNLTSFIESVYKTDDDAVTLFLFNTSNEITLAKDTGLVFSKANIADHLGDAFSRVLNTARRLNGLEITSFIHGGAMYAVSSIPQLDWYLVVSIPISFVTLIDPMLSAVFIAMLVLILLVIIAFNIFLSRAHDEVEEQNINLVVASWKPMGNFENVVPAHTRTQSVSFTAPNARVLVVGDMPSNLIVVERLLAPYEMQVSTCTGGREAIAMLSDQTFDLVLMDHMMPEMDGMEATAAIRAIPEPYYRQLPIIALTDNAISGMQEVFLQNGFSDFLSKPIEIPKLHGIMEKWVPGQKRQKASRTVIPANDRPVSTQPFSMPAIEGVNTAVGVARVGGSTAHYLDLLETFRRDVIACLPFLKISATPDEAECKAFNTQAHALKNALANIGANALSATAATLEAARREDDMLVIHAHLAPFREALAVLAERIRGALEAIHAENDGEISDVRANEMFVRLAKALETENIDEMDTALGALQALKLAPATREALAGITESVLMADFERAAEIVKGLTR
jgi:CheY-like chemotaxis protein